MRALRLLSCGSWDFASPEGLKFLVLVAPYLFPVVGSKTWLTLLALDTKALQSLLDPLPHVLLHWQVLYVNKSSPVDSSQCKARSRKAGIGRPSFICLKKLVSLLNSCLHRPALHANRMMVLHCSKRELCLLKDDKDPPFTCLKQSFHSEEFSLEDGILGSSLHSGLLITWWMAQRCICVWPAPYNTPQLEPAKSDPLSNTFAGFEAARTSPLPAGRRHKLCVAVAKVETRTILPPVSWNQSNCLATFIHCTFFNRILICRRPWPAHVV